MPGEGSFLQLIISHNLRFYLNHQRLHAQLCDCVVVVGGQTFQAHRSILAASSSHFRALLNSIRRVMELDPEVVTPEAFSTLLDMIYTSTLSLGVSNVMDVLLAASHLHLNAVVKACKLHLSRKNFPASAPKGWRSVQRQSPCSQAASAPQHQVTSATEEDPEPRDGGVEVSQSGEDENEGVRVQVEKEEQEEPRIAVVEVKKENLTSYSSDLDTMPNISPPSPLEAQIGDGKMQILPAQSSGFGDTIILQPNQNSLAGFLSGIRPGLSLDAAVVQPSRAGKSAGAPAFRRIAPKVVPGSEPSADALSGSAESAERPSLTRASDDVLSKCKKAAAEDHVLLVEGEKKYACKICCKTFMNLTDCKKHIRVHTGEKPYPCPKCGKRFSQSSHLYKHSKNTCMSWKDDQSFPDSLL
uniref:Zinc finger and BTB domain-containing protein 5-like n=1 Tax=Fundulus heteroclitus TaxID=8078 RepID=A0A3Q2Q344_FUNHE